MLSHEYVRSALKRGLEHEAQLGANPFKFGMIGSTDSHTSLATAAEDNFFGKFAESEPGPRTPANRHGRQPHVGKLEALRFGVRGRVGAGEHPGGTVRRHEAPRGVRHFRPAHRRALLRRMGLRPRRHPQAHLAGHRLRQGHSHGRRPHRGAGRPRARVHRSRRQRPGRRQPRPYPDRQGLARRQRNPPRAGLRRGAFGRSWSRSANRQGRAGGLDGERRRGELRQTASATRSSLRCGPTPTSTRATAPSTTFG